MLTQDPSLSQRVLTQYQNFCLTTVVYPLYSDVIQFPYRQNPFYCGLGLVDEAGEFEESMLGQSVEDQMKELGDVLWYATMLCHEHGHSLAAMQIHGQEVLGGYQNHHTYGLLMLSSKVAGCIKKLWRDGRSAKVEMALKDSLAAVIACIDEHAFILGAENGIETIAEISRSKLTRRKTEGKLHGSGSDR